MAYIITNQNSLYKIAADDTAKSKLNINESDYEITTISDADFNKLKLQTGSLEHSNGSYSVVDIPNISIINEDVLKKQIEFNIDFFERWMDNNQGHSNYNTVNSYCTYLRNFDTSSLTYPMNQTFEQYLVANSIDFISPLQI